MTGNGHRLDSLIAIISGYIKKLCVFLFEKALYFCFLMSVFVSTIQCVREDLNK